MELFAIKFRFWEVDSPVGPQTQTAQPRLPRPPSHQHLLPLSVPRCSVCNYTTSPTGLLPADVLVNNPSLCLQGQVRVEVVGLVSPTGLHWLPGEDLPPLPSSSCTGPSMFPILPPCFPQRSNALMGQICSLYGKHVGSCQTPGD